MRPAGQSIVVDHIGELITASGGIGLAHDAAVVIVDGRVVFAGPRGQAPHVADAACIDAGGRLASPGLVEPHSHLVFAGSRAHEFDLRAQGKSYLQIQAAGGGIASSVRATTTASSESLLHSALARLDEFLLTGATTVEAKTGYALTIDGELRLLDILRQAQQQHLVDLSPTLLAHVPPLGVDAQERAEYVRRFCAEAIVQARDVAEAVDVYCDEGAFTLDEALTILRAGQAAGLALRAHAEQFSYTGIAERAAELGARSVEHLELLGPSAPALLKQSGTVCNLLPGAVLTCRLPWPDARRLIDAGCTVALGTDCNPGSSLSESQALMMSLACMQMGLSCAEAWLGVTRHAALAVGRRDAGFLAPGARGDLVLWDADDYRQVAQHFGANLARTVIVAGRVVVADGRLVTSRSV